MKRTAYKGYIIDTDNLGRPYIYNTASPYSEDSDHKLVRAKSIKECKAIIDAEIEYIAEMHSFLEQSERTESESID